MKRQTTRSAEPSKSTDVWLYALAVAIGVLLATIHWLLGVLAECESTDHKAPAFRTSPLQLRSLDSFKLTGLEGPSETF